MTYNRKECLRRRGVKEKIGREEERSLVPFCKWHYSRLDKHKKHIPKANIHQQWNRRRIASPPPPTLLKRLLSFFLSLTSHKHFFTISIRNLSSILLYVLHSKTFVYLRCKDFKTSRLPYNKLKFVKQNLKNQVEYCRLSIKLRCHNRKRYKFYIFLT